MSKRSRDDCCWDMNEDGTRDRRSYFSFMFKMVTSLSGWSRAPEGVKRNLRENKQWLPEHMALEMDQLEKGLKKLKRREKVPPKEPKKSTSIVVIDLTLDDDDPMSLSGEEQQFDIQPWGEGEADAIVNDIVAEEVCEALAEEIQEHCAGWLDGFNNDYVSNCFDDAPLFDCQGFAASCLIK